MLVSFLQALLAMLRKELDSFSIEDSSAMQLAGVIEGTTPALVEGGVATGAVQKPVTAKSSATDGVRGEGGKSPQVSAKASPAE
jgi:hypothetical protein